MPTTATTTATPTKPKSKPKAEDTTTAPRELPALPDTIAIIGACRDRLQLQARQFDRATLCDRIRIGVACLAAQEHHALPPEDRGQGRKSLTRRGSDSSDLSEISPEQPHPQGFLSWLDHNVGWLARPTVYKYMDAARGAGLTAWSGGGEVVETVSNLLAEHESLSLAALVAQGKLPAPADGDADGDPAPPAPKQSPEQLTFASLRDFRVSSEQVIACRDAMSPEAYQAACGRAYATLKALTGQAWQPGETDPEDYADLLDDY